MRLKQQVIGVLVWLAVLPCWLLAIWGFGVVAPWTHDVMSVADSAVRCPGATDPSWPAVVCSHGRPHKWELGLFADNPIPYIVALAQLVIGVGGFLLGVFYLKWFKRSQVERTQD